MQHPPLPMGKTIVIETCISAPYKEEHCDDTTPEL